MMLVHNFCFFFEKLCPIVSYSIYIYFPYPLSNRIAANFFLCFSGTLEINCSKEIKIQGVVGPCTSLEKVRWSMFQTFHFLFLVDSGIRDCLVNELRLNHSMIFLDFDCYYNIAERAFCCWYRHRRGQHNSMEDVWPGQEYMFDCAVWSLIKWTFKCFRRCCQPTTVPAVPYKVMLGKFHKYDLNIYYDFVSSYYILGSWALIIFVILLQLPEPRWSISASCDNSN
jgi:hypothetical protein